MRVPETLPRTLENRERTDDVSRNLSDRHAENVHRYMLELECGMFCVCACSAVLLASDRIRDLRTYVRHLRVVLLMSLGES